MVTKIADALEVSVDYLVGKTSMVLDQDTLQRMEEVAKLPEDKAYIFQLVDVVIRDFKNKRAYAH